MRGVENRTPSLQWWWWVAALAGSLLVGYLVQSVENGGARKTVLISVGIIGATAAVVGVIRFRANALTDIGLLQATSILFFLPGLALAPCAGFRLTTNMTMGDPFIALGVVFAFASLIERRGWYVPPWLGLCVICLVASWALTDGFPGAFPEPYITADGLTRFANPGISVSQASQLLLFSGVILLFPLSLGGVLSSSTLIRSGARAFVAGATLSGLIGIADRFLHTDVGSRLTGLSFNGFAGNVVRTGGLATHPNQYALTLAMSAPIALSFAITTRSRFERMFCFVILGVDALGILISGSRSGVASLTVALLLIPVLHGAYRNIIVLSALACGLFITAVLVFTSVGGSTQLVAVDRLNNSAITYQSDALRLEFYSNGLREIEAHPWRGIGFEALRASHDVYIQLAQSGGAFALLAFVVFVVGIFRAGFGQVRQRSNDWCAQHLAAALVASTAAWIVFSTVQPALYDRFLYVPAGLIFAMVALSRRQAKADPDGASAR